MKTFNEFEEVFDRGEEIDEYVDWSRTRRPNLEQKRVNLDLPLWMIELLDREAKRLEIARQAVMKIFLAERLEGLK
ncbi:type II toxin-antitoxin system BrnA family antitoxin [Nitratifractor sp.]